MSWPHIRQSKEHELKTWSPFFSALLTGEKTFELRKDDRGFQAGDTLWLREWAPKKKFYTGREMRVEVTYLLGGQWPGLALGYVVMGIRRLD